MGSPTGAPTRRSITDTLSHRAWLPIALFAAVSAAFVAVGYVERAWLEPADRDATRIAENTAPAIELLSGARSEARSLQVLASTFARAPTAEQRRQLETSVASYRTLPTLAGEDARDVALERAERRVEEATETLLGDAVGAGRPADAQLAAEVVRFNDAAASLVAFKAEQSARLATRISSVHRQIERIGSALELACLVLAAAAAAVAYRLRRQNDELLRAQTSAAVARAAELDLFAARVAHDIRSPLQAAKLGLDFARRKSSGDAPVESMLERAERSVGRVLSMTHALLDFARSDAAVDADERAEAASVVRAICEELQPEATRADVELRVGRAEVADARCSEGALTSVVSNLLRNAIRYMGESPTRWIEVRVARARGVVRIEVEDSGPGVPPQIEGTLFDLYVRGSGNEPGLGLGLATAKRLVERHGGRIGHAPAPGGGALFWFEVPLAANAVE